jgi:hypothetical protein
MKDHSNISSRTLLVDYVYYIMSTGQQLRAFQIFVRPYPTGSSSPSLTREAERSVDMSVTVCRSSQRNIPAGLKFKADG